MDNTSRNLIDSFLNKHNNLIQLGLSMIFIHERKIKSPRQFVDSILIDSLKFNNTRGFLYCIYNDFYILEGEDVYKLGCTKNMIQRSVSYTTCYSRPIVIKHLSSKVDYYDIAESILFEKLSKCRLYPRREFFQCKLDVVIQNINDTVTEIKDGNILDLITKYDLWDCKLCGIDLFKLENDVINFMNLNGDIMNSIFRNYVPLVHRNIANKETKCTVGLNYLLGKDVNINCITTKDMQKIIVVKEIINTLGFDMEDLTKMVKGSDFYANSKNLLVNSNFGKNYNDIQKLFNKPRSKFNIKLKGTYLTGMLNSYLDEFGLCITSTNKRKWNVKLKKQVRTSDFVLRIKNIV